ncbi:DEAD-domain-containing protein [Dacryopinax primogenitus]|uniref:ATP-dependent RNA helicase n=1 Tax=Dacryopinax primogenitus (strain DJM 731) TaxID=1858805 RepID=M5G3P2_DACPD|nr:DEAD-domain-containing protein [Dacryopinax primogenitus]EJU04856.1 DEAD-domain-containing protein [Dacryopinax primogenitus]
MATPQVNGRPSHAPNRKRTRPPPKPQPSQLRTSGSAGVFTSTSQASGSPALSVPAAVPPASTDKSAYLSNVQFSDFLKQGLLTKPVFDRIPFEYCTEVQEKTLKPILEGKDVFGQAKTGTGKTIAFLVPSIDRLARKPVPPPGIISILVLAPTRELCLQIEAEANMLLEGSLYRAQSAIGGVNIKVQRNNLLLKRSDILIATPGRLVDHIENSNLTPRLRTVQTFILDEADRLLDQGFQKSILQIARAITPKDQRQTLLFSATVDKQIREISNVVLKQQHEFISTIGEEEEATHKHVAQDYIIAPLAKIDAVLLTLLRQAVESPFTKIIVFFSTARGAAIAYDLFRAIPDLEQAPMFEMHSRMSQGARVKQADGFRETMKGILFSSDVTARGMDFPGITAVYQVGMPSSPEQYIHRLGRTARAGAQGHGILILSDFEEEAFLSKKEIRELPLKRHAGSDELVDEQSPAFKSAQEMVSQTYQAMESVSKAQAYQAWMGYYNSYLKVLRWTKQDLVQRANDYAMNVLKYQCPDGSNNTPPLLPKTVGMMGLKGVLGLNIVKPQRVDRAGGSGSSQPPRKRQKAEP